MVRFFSLCGVLVNLVSNLIFFREKKINYVIFFSAPMTPPTPPETTTRVNSPIYVAYPDGSGTFFPSCEVVVVLVSNLIFFHEKFLQVQRTLKQLVLVRRE